MSHGDNGKHTKPCDRELGQSSHVKALERMPEWERSMLHFKASKVAMLAAVSLPRDRRCPLGTCAGIHSDQPLSVCG